MYAIRSYYDLRVRDAVLDNPAVLILTGKGNKVRRVPLMKNTLTLLEHYIRENSLDKPRITSYNVCYTKLLRKDNCFKGREFKDIADAKEFLEFWLNDIANKRIHGTIKKIPAELFEEVEKTKLKELPVEDFVFSKSSRANVGPNCHISYNFV